MFLADEALAAVFLADAEALAAVFRADVEAFTAVFRADVDALAAVFRADVVAFAAVYRADVDAFAAVFRADVEALAAPELAASIPARAFSFACDIHDEPAVTLGSNSAVAGRGGPDAASVNVTVPCVSTPFRVCSGAAVN